MASLVKEEQILLRNFFVFGVCFGLCFPIMALSIDFWVKNINFSIANIYQIHLKNPIHFIIDTAPIILSLTAFQIGRLVIFRERKTKLQLESALSRTQKFYEYTTHLLEDNFDYPVDIDDSEEFQSLLVLKNKIIASRQREAESSWVNSALQEISEAIRENKTSKNELGKQLLSSIAKILGANMGILYANFGDESNQKIVSIATYAIDMNTPLFLEIEKGEGLVGQCFAEKKTIHLTNIPENYLEINSGLGSLKPDTLTLAPLLFNEQVYGVIELACFGQLTNEKLKFIDKAAELIGYTFSYLNLSINDFEKTTLNG